MPWNFNDLRVPKVRWRSLRFAEVHLEIGLLMPQCFPGSLPPRARFRTQPMVDANLSTLMRESRRRL